jgi:hypothetical protein
MTGKRSKQNLTLLGGIGIGAALMYFLDPKRGPRRRHLVKDRATSVIRNGRWQLRKATQDVKHRAFGVVHEVQGRVEELAQGEHVPQDVLIARVRAALGHHVRQAGGIEVTTKGSTVTLRGAVPPEELHRLLAAVARVRGVREVDNQLHIRASPAPALQG